MDLKALDPKYEAAGFLEFIFDPIEKSQNPMMEASKLSKTLPQVVPSKWKGILILFPY